MQVSAQSMARLLIPWLSDAVSTFNNFLQTSTTRLQEFGSKLKREMLMKLATKDLHPLDPNKREKIYRKYEVRFVKEFDQNLFAAMFENKATIPLSTCPSKVCQKLEIKYAKSSRPFYIVIRCLMS